MSDFGPVSAAAFPAFCICSARVRDEMWRGFGRLFGGALARWLRAEVILRLIKGISSASIPNHCLYVKAVVLLVSELLTAKRFRKSEPPEARYRPGELETSVAAATAWRRRGCSGSPGELFAPATAPQHKLCSGWKRPAPAERSRRAERSRKDCERHARRRAERPSFWSVPRWQPAETPPAACGEATRRKSRETRRRERENNRPALPPQT